jgi:outer membrane protein TolC
MRQEFNFFDTDKSWYRSSVIGVRLTLPIFDGLQRNYRYSQAILNSKIATENLNLTEQTLKVNLSNFEIQYRNAIENIGREQENLTLAENVYKSSQLEYKEGTLTTLDLIQSETSYLIAQNNYYSKLLSLYLARVDLEKAKGTLSTFINK